MNKYKYNNNFKFGNGINNKNYNRQNNNFCTNIDYNTKNMIIKYIYDSIDLKKYKYTLLKYEEDLARLESEKYYITPNYNGLNSLLVFKKIRQKYFSFIIDRKTLSFNYNQLNINKVKIIKVNISLDEKIYDGSIFDGVLLYGKDKNRKKIFIINDVYYFNNKDKQQELIMNKIIQINTYLKKNYKPDKDLDNTILNVNKLYNIKNIKELINIYIPSSYYKNSIKGVCFYPEISGMKLIFLFNNTYKENSPQQFIKEPPIFFNNKNNQNNNNLYDNTLSNDLIFSKNNKTAIFKMKSTEIVDVYNLFTSKKINYNNRNAIILKKHDIAYIPTKEMSIYFQNIFTNKDSIMVECEYCSEKNKWIPKKVSDAKLPDYIDKI